MTPRCALIIDDSLDDRRVIRRHLNRDTRYQYEIIEAASGREGLEAVARCKPDVVILDQVLGDMRGTEVLTRLRGAGYSDLPIVVLSGSSDDSVDPLELGADDCLNKEEVSGAYLRRAISNAFTKARMRTLLEQKERSLKEALEEVQQRMAFESRLIGVVSHDLRTPLGAVGLGVEALQEESGLSEDGQEILARVSRSTEHVISMVTQLFDLTRIRQGGTFPIEVEDDADLVSVVRDRVEELAAAAGPEQVRFEAMGPARASFDPTAMGQVAVNLINNALKHGASGKPVHVRVEEGPKGVSMRVTNTGDPIPEDVQATLFEPFVRGPKAGSGGLGLGLFIANGIAVAHGTRILVESSANQITFGVTLPRSTA